MRRTENAAVTLCFSDHSYYPLNPAGRAGNITDIESGI
jgi:hypothetical protein